MLGRHRPPPPPRKHRPPRRRRLWLYGLWLAVAMMTVCAATAAGVFMGYVRSLPPLERLEHYTPPEVSRVYDRSGAHVIGEFKTERRFVTPIRDIPKRLQNAFIAVEDSRFRRHYGVDVLGVLRAALANWRAGRIVQGGSTITQQLTRNILPRQIGFERKLERKIKEAILSFQVERRYSKDQILEFYLNQITFSYNAFGVRAAAATYFSKPLDELTLAECATLAGIPKAPSIYNPIRNPERARKRRDVILKRMFELNMIDAEELKTALGELIEVRYGGRATSPVPYFLDALERDLMSHYDVDEAFLKQRGLRIDATIDPAIQAICVQALREGLIADERLWQKRKPSRRLVEHEDLGWAYRRGQTRLMKIETVTSDTVSVRQGPYWGVVERPAPPLPYYEPENIVKPGAWLDVRIEAVDPASGRIEGRWGDRHPLQGSVVVLDVSTGEVLALVGGTDFYDKRLGWFNRAVQGGRQVGSCFKPFIYAAAMTRGVALNEIVIDEEVVYPREYIPVNYEDEYFGPTTLIEALEHSRNVVTIRLFDWLGPSRALRTVERFDFTQDTPRWQLPAVLSTCLGTIDCSPLEMAAAYQALANRGVGIRPQFFSSVTDADGRPAIPIKRREAQIIDPVSAYQTQYLLRRVVLDGTGRWPIGRHFPSPPAPPICGKTGTTTGCRDAWFCGFTPELVIVVQVGFDTPRTMGPRMTGGRVAGTIWANILRETLKTRETWAMTFQAPPDIELANICAVTGKRADALCREENHHVYFNVPFRVGTTPLEACDGVVRDPLIAPFQHTVNLDALGLE